MNKKPDRQSFTQNENVKEETNLFSLGLTSSNMQTEERMFLPGNVILAQ